MFCKMSISGVVSPRLQNLENECIKARKDSYSHKFSEKDILFIHRSRGGFGWS